MVLGRVFLAMLSGFAAGATLWGATSEPLQTVSSVDLKRYAGKWYEIARYPNRFQRDCESDTIATYTLRPDGKVQVVNQCRQKDGKMDVAKGVAKVADRATNAKLKVTFFWPFYGDYWVIALDPEYQYAVVGEPDRKYLWILSRAPKMDKAFYDNVIAKIRAAGYDPARLIQTPQTGQP